MHDVRPVLVEGLKAGHRTNGPLGDELKGVAMIGGADLGFDFPCLFIQFKLLRARRIGRHEKDFDSLSSWCSKRRERCCSCERRAAARSLIFDNLANFSSK